MTNLPIVGTIGMGYDAVPSSPHYEERECAPKVSP